MPEFSFAELAARGVEGALEGLQAVAAQIMEASLEQCPVDTGTLRGSAKIDEPSRGFSTISVTMGYGFGDEINEKTRRPASEYAVPVHERLEAAHAPPTKAKFLEDPVIEYATQLGPTVAVYMQMAFTGKGGPKATISQLNLQMNTE